MGVEPDEIQLSDNDKKLLASAANKSGKPWRHILRELLSTVLQQRPKPVAPDDQPELPLWEGNVITPLSREAIYGQKH